MTRSVKTFVRSCLLCLGVFFATGFSDDFAAPFAYITNAGSGNVSVIDTATNTVVATVGVGTSPYGVAVNLAGTFTYVANQGSNTVSVINTATNTVVANVGVGANPYGVAVNPAGTFAYVANVNSNTVSVIDTATNTVVANVNVGTNPLAFGAFIGPAPAAPVPSLPDAAMIVLVSLMAALGIKAARRSGRVAS